MTNTCKSSEFSALILAGGLSRRMGEDKSKLLTPQGISLLQHSCNLVHEAGSSQVLISSNTEPEGINDNFFNAGPLAGIEAGLAKVVTHYVVILPVDMPLLTPGIIYGLLDYALHNKQACCYQEQCLPLVLTRPDVAHRQAQKLLQSKQKCSIWQFCRAINAKEIEIPEMPTAKKNGFKNANDPLQWLECQKLMD